MPQLVLKTETGMGLNVSPYFQHKTGNLDLGHRRRHGGDDGGERENSYGSEIPPIWTSAPNRAPPRWGGGKAPMPGSPGFSGNEDAPAFVVLVEEGGSGADTGGQRGRQGAGRGGKRVLTDEREADA